MAQLEQYPIPKIDLFATLGGGWLFTELDKSRAHQQLVLDGESKHTHTHTNMHKGLFRYNCLPIGVSSAPEIFQRTMGGLLG